MRDERHLHETLKVMEEVGNWAVEPQETNRDAVYRLSDLLGSELGFILTLPADIRAALPSDTIEAIARHKAGVDRIIRETHMQEVALLCEEISDTEPDES